MRDIFAIAIILLVVVLLIYTDAVKQTVREMVKEGALK